MSSHAPSVVAGFHRINRGDSSYPQVLVQRLGEQAPASLVACGNIALLTRPKTALFCSARCPGHAILAAYDQAAKWRDAGRCIISGFHSPVERDCLHILLRGKQPIIICPARTLTRFRVPAEWQASLDAGRLLVMSPFTSTARRTSARLAAQRNEFVASLADEAVFVHTTPGGNLEHLTRRFPAWGIVLSRPLSGPLKS